MSDSEVSALVISDGNGNPFKVTFCCKDKVGCPELTLDGDHAVLQDDYGNHVRIPVAMAKKMFNPKLTGILFPE